MIFEVQFLKKIGLQKRFKIPPKSIQMQDLTKKQFFCICIGVFTYFFIQCSNTAYTNEFLGSPQEPPRNLYAPPKLSSIPLGSLKDPLKIFRTPLDFNRTTTSSPPYKPRQCLQDPHRGSQGTCMSPPSSPYHPLRHTDPLKNQWLLLGSSVLQIKLVGHYKLLFPSLKKPKTIFFSKSN